MEYRILMRINCHKAQFGNLFKSSSSDFRRRNKYNEILPYEHNMVRIAAPIFEDSPVDDNRSVNAGGVDRFTFYYNASFINVRANLKFIHSRQALLEKKELKHSLLLWHPLPGQLTVFGNS